MEYYLSQERKAKKESFKKQIDGKEQELRSLQQEIGEITVNTDISWQIKKIELQIKQKEIEKDIAIKRWSIRSLYAGEICQNLKDRKRNTSMQTEGFLHDKYMADFYLYFTQETCVMKDLMHELDILTMKISLLFLKKASRRVSKKEAEQEMAKIQGKLVEISADLQEVIDSIADQYKNYKRKALQLPIQLGREISNEQIRTINDQVTQLDETEGIMPTDNEIDNIEKELTRKYLVQQSSSELSQTAPNETEIKVKIKSFSYYKPESDESFNVYKIQIRYDNGKTKIFRVKVNKESESIIDNKELRKLLVELLRDKGLINFDSSNEEVKLGTLIIKNGKLIVKEEVEEAR